MRPEWALAGSVTTSPGLARRSREAGEPRVISAPAERGKATAIPAVSPLPLTSRVPPVDTWWGLALQRASGTQRALVMRIAPALRPGAPLVPLASGGEPFGVPPPGAVPPASAGERAGSPRQHSSRPASAARRSFDRLDRLCTPVPAKKLSPGAAGPSPASATSDV